MSNLRNKLTNLEDVDLSAQEMLWLEPDNKVWQSVRDQIPTKKKRRWPFLMLIAIILGTATYGLLQMDPSNEASIAKASNIKDKEVLHDNNTENVSKKEQVEAVLEANNVQSSLQTENSQLSNQQPSIQPVLTNQVSKVSTSQTSKAASSEVNAFLSNNTEKEIVSQIIKNAIISPISSEKESNPMNISASGIAKNIDVDIINNQIDVRPSKSFARLSPLVSNLTFARDLRMELMPISKQVEEKKSRISLGLMATYSPFGNDISIKNTNLPLSETIKNSTYDHHRSLGLQLSVALNNRFSIVAMPRLSREELSTSYSLDIPYNYLSETTDGSQYINSFTHSLPTDAGQVNTTLVVTRSLSSPVKHNEVVNFDLTSVQQLKAIQLPIMAEYKFGSGRQKWAVMAGGIGHLELSNDVSTGSWVSNHTHIATHSSKLEIESANNAIKIGASLGLNYNLAVTPRFSIKPTIMYHRFFADRYRQQLVDTGISMQYKF